MKRMICVKDGIISVEQIGNLYSICGYKYFKHVSDSGIGVHISELTTGFALPNCSSFADAKRFLNKKSKEKRVKAMNEAKKSMIKSGIQYPLNNEKI